MADDIEAMRAQVEAHDAKVRAEKMAPLAKLVGSKPFQQVEAEIAALGSDLDNERQFGPFVKAIRTGMAGLKRATERAAAKG